jgi:hypothetical protein
VPVQQPQYLEARQQEYRRTVADQEAAGAEAEPEERKAAAEPTTGMIETRGRNQR